MSRLSQALLATSALAALSIITVSCGSNVDLAQVRIINAIPDSQPVDVYINGVRIASSLPFDTISPNTAHASYIPVHSGSDTVQGFPPGDTTNPISPIGIIPLNGSTQYTLIAVGFELSESAPLALLDDNTPPTAGNAEFRIVNVSLSSPQNGVDVYFVPPGTDIAQYTPQITGLSYGQASRYQPFAALAGGYSVIVTANGSKVPLITQLSTAPAGSITTVVIVDNAPGNNGMSTTPLILNDLN
jgi:Domain of unknown function (DUF4397)